MQELGNLGEVAEHILSGPKFPPSKVLQKLWGSAGFLSCKPFRRTFLQNPKGSAEFWGQGGRTDPSFLERLVSLPKSEVQAGWGERRLQAVLLSGHVDVFLVMESDAKCSKILSDLANKPLSKEHPENATVLKTRKRCDVYSAPPDDDAIFNNSRPPPSLIKMEHMLRELGSYILAIS